MTDFDCLQSLDLAATCVHEAGHAIAAHALGCRIGSIRLEDDGNAKTEVLIPDDKPMLRWAIALAGPAAHQYGWPHIDCAIAGLDDYSSTMESIQAHVGTLTLADIDIVAEQLEEFSEQVARALVEQHWESIKALAAYLLREKALSEEQIDQFFASEDAVAAKLQMTT